MDRRQQNQRSQGRQNSSGANRNRSVSNRNGTVQSRNRNNSKKKAYDPRRKRVFLGSMILIVAAIVGMIFWCLYSYVNKWEEGQVPEGIYIEDVELTGMTEAEVWDVIEAIIEDRGEATITLITTEPEESEIGVKLSELGLMDSNGTEIVEEIMNCGKEGNLFSRYYTLRRVKNTGVVYDLSYEVDLDVVSAFVDTTYAEVIHSFVDASIEYSNGTLTVIDGEDGMKIDVEQAVTQIEAFMSAEWEGESGEIYLTTIEVEPDITTEILANVTDVLGTFETYCANSGNRWDNVARGAEIINGTIVMPGEEFAFAETVQPFTEENGYANAGSYSDGQVVDSMGGGICQVSTTLYNAALYAELEITQRSGHSMLVSYVEPAMDAAIAGDYKDLKFVNNTDSPIYIYADLTGTSLVFTIYGEEMRDESRTIEFDSVIIEDNGYGNPVFQENSELSLGTISKVSSGYVGKVAELWKYVYVDGELVSEDRINSSTYNSTPETYDVGTKSDSSSASATVRSAISTQSQDKINAAITEAKAIVAQEASDAAAAQAEQEAAAQAAEQAEVEAQDETEVEE